MSFESRSLHAPLNFGSGCIAEKSFPFRWCSFTHSRNANHHSTFSNFHFEYFVSPKSKPAQDTRLVHFLFVANVKPIIFALTIFWERERNTHAAGLRRMDIFTWTSFLPLFLQTCTGDKKNKARTKIIYTTEREDKIIDSESCVNVREWHACVNMGDGLLSMFVWMRAVGGFEQCEICNKRFLLTQDRF